MLAVQMAPCVSALGLWMPAKIENLNILLPDCFAAKNFMDRHGFNVNRAAVVQLRNRDLNLRQIILFIRHSVLLILG